MSDPKRLTTAEVAAQLHVKPKTVSRWTADGILRGSKVGLRWLYAQEDVDAFVASRVNIAPAATDRRRRRRAA